MGKKKKNRRRKGSLLPLLAIGVGVYLLTRRPRVLQDIPPVIVTLPNYPPVINPPMIQRLAPRRLMPKYV